MNGCTLNIMGIGQKLLRVGFPELASYTLALAQGHMKAWVSVSTKVAKCKTFLI